MALTLTTQLNCFKLTGYYFRKLCMLTPANENNEIFISTIIKTNTGEITDLIDTRIKREETKLLPGHVIIQLKVKLIPHIIKEYKEKAIQLSDEEYEIPRICPWEKITIEDLKTNISSNAKRNLEEAFKRENIPIFKY